MGLANRLGFQNKCRFCSNRFDRFCWWK